jgi:hypothetical protein
MQSSKKKLRSEEDIRVSLLRDNGVIAIQVGGKRDVVALDKTPAQALREVADRLEKEGTVRWWNVVVHSHEGLFSREVAEVIVEIAHDISRKTLLSEIQVFYTLVLDGVDVFRSLFERPNSLVSLDVPPFFLPRMMPRGSHAISQSLHLRLPHYGELDHNIASFVSAARIKKLTLRGMPMPSGVSSLPLMDELKDLWISNFHSSDDPNTLVKFLTACPGLEELKMPSIMLRGRGHILPRILDSLARFPLTSLCIRSSDYGEGGPWVQDATQALGRIRTLKKLDMGLRRMKPVHMNFVTWSLPHLREIEYDGNTGKMREVNIALHERDGYMMLVALGTALGDLARDLAQFI